MPQKIDHVENNAYMTLNVTFNIVSKSGDKCHD
jgi:hypothetical protein